jgi:hypothetical protein
VQSLDQWLFRWDPTNFSFTVLVFIVLVVSLLFIVLKWWPWYSREAWPARQRIEEEHIQAMNRIGETLIELKLLVSQNAVMMNTIVERLDRSEQSRLN